MNKNENNISRRDFLITSIAAAMALSGGAVAQEIPKSATSKKIKKESNQPYNILFILTDQERYIEASELPRGFKLSGHDRLKESGITFTNHHINSAVCTSSRSVIYTGQHIQHTKLYDNMDVPWMANLSKDMPTIGDMMQKAGYYPAYKGKWHLSKELGTHDEAAIPQVELTKVIEGYGFHDYIGIGDVIGMTQGGYINDEMIAAQAKRWLRLKAAPLQAKKEPWFLAVNFVNPHDVMFYNTDTSKEHVQDRPSPLMDIEREPASSLYARQWKFTLPQSRNESFEKKGRPQAHSEYQKARGALVGNFPNEDERWQRLLNYYFNCISNVDRAIDTVLDELDAQGMRENTIVVLTSDHGELGGSHATHGKGATAYKEQNHVPLIISHPDFVETHGERCNALTSHIDLAPTILSWTKNSAKVNKADLKGHDFTHLLALGNKATVNDIRKASLYCYNMFLYLDSDYTLKTQAYLNEGGDPKKLAQMGIKPDLKKRGAIRSIFDGRYKYTRYYSPLQHNEPKTIQEILKYNDIELFDLKNDFEEIHNLAIDIKKNETLILAMNDKMNEIIKEEVGVDDGSFLPGESNQWSTLTFDP